VNFAPWVAEVGVVEYGRGERGGGGASQGGEGASFVQLGVSVADQAGDPVDAGALLGVAVRFVSLALGPDPKRRPITR